MKVFLVVPAYNEGNTIAKVLRKCEKYCENIIVVDDGSTDNTALEVEWSGVGTLLKHSANLGKGAALRTGCDYARNAGAELIIVMDSDGQHRPRDIPKLLKCFPSADIAFASREFTKSMPFTLRFGNEVLTTLIQWCWQVFLLDSQSGFRAFTREAYDKIRWRSNSYAMESEMIMNVSKHRLSYDEVFIPTIYGDDYKGTSVVDGVKIALKILWWRCTR